MLLCRFNITLNVQVFRQFGHSLLCPPGTEVFTRKADEISTSDQRLMAAQNH